MKTIEVRTPFDFCEKCTYCELKTIQLYADGDYLPQYACKFRHICSNTVQLYKKEGGNQSD